MHALEKILARGFGVEEVKTGQIANCDVDIAGINDLYSGNLFVGDRTLHRGYAHHAVIHVLVFDIVLIGGIDAHDIVMSGEHVTAQN